MRKKIFKVKKIDLNIEKSNPPMLVIDCKGIVPSSTWSNAELVPYIYINPPEDGIYEFDFNGNSPEIGDTKMSEINAQYEWEDFPHDLTGVRIYASQNKLQEILHQNTKPKEFINQDESFLLKKVTANELEIARKDNDFFSIENVFIWEHTLEIRVRYGGGCKKHNFKLLWDGTERESNPVQIPLFLYHDNNDDPCKGIVTMRLQFDLSPTLQHGVTLDLDGWEKLIVY